MEAWTVSLQAGSKNKAIEEKSTLFYPSKLNPFHKITFWDLKYDFFFVPSIASDVLMHLPS